VCAVTIDVVSITVVSGSTTTVVYVTVDGVVDAVEFEMSAAKSL